MAQDIREERPWDFFHAPLVRGFCPSMLGRSDLKISVRTDEQLISKPKTCFQLFLAGRCGSRRESGTLNSRGARQSLHAFATPLRKPHLLPCSPRSVFPLRVQIPNWSENRIARKAWTEVRVDLPFCGSEGGRFGFRSPDFKDLARPPGARVVTPRLNLTPLRTARDSSWFSHPFRAGRRLCLGVGRQNQSEQAR